MNNKNVRRVRKSVFIVIALVLTMGLLLPVNSTQALPQKAQPVTRAVSTQPPTDQIIINYLSGSVPADPGGATQMGRLSTAASTSLSTAGVTLSYLRKMSATTYVLKLSKALQPTTVQTICNELATLSEVEYAEPDKILRHADTIPSENIPPNGFFGSQWFFTGPFGIRAPAAWDKTTGNSSIVVAVLDTGLNVMPSGLNMHNPDIDLGRIVSGYDFIGNNFRAGDGDGRDGLPNDAGDYITYSENQGTDPSGGLFTGCSISNSSWHGTHVAGIVGAWTNNAAGVAGVDWTSRILPVRVLGKCGGYVSDIVDGMRWAAGLSVEGVSVNSNPANVINLSLGGAGTCSLTTQSAIDDVVAAGSVVVAAAGNDADDAGTFFPGNCNGVITVGSTDAEGHRSDFSNYGSTVEISAPGGSTLNTGGIYSTSNPGTTSWDTTYISDATNANNYEYKSGTSMAAAEVSGVVSLMFSINPDLTPDQTLKILQKTAYDFSDVVGSNPLCTTSTCGAGIVDANEAVMVAAMPDLFIKSMRLLDPSTDLPIIPGPDIPFKVEVTVKNQGKSSLGGSSTTGLYKDLTSIPSSCPGIGTVTTTWATSDLSSGNEETYTYLFSSGLPQGPHTLYVYVDANCVVSEGLEDNNIYSIPVGGAKVNIDIGGTNQGAYDLESGTSMVAKYDVDGGPVVISSNGGAKIVASLNQWRRNAWSPIGQFTGVAQSMALPVELITNKYVIPRYNNTDPSLYNAVLMANVDTVPRTLTVTIGKTVVGTYPLDPSHSVYGTYNITDGPIVVSSDPGAKIIASLYELKRYQAGVPWNGQNEMMGVPAGQLSDKYVLPLYFGAANPLTLDARLYIANADTIDTTVEVKIAGVSQGTYPIAPGTSMVAKYDVDGGPVVISSNNGAKIVASLNQWRRNAWSPIGQFTGVAQSMALPVEKVTNKYVIPRYNNTDPTLYNAVLMANVDTVPRTLTVTIGKTVVGTYPLDPSQSVYGTYNITDGPIVVSSDPGAKIIASLYELKRYQAGVPWNGQSEMMGVPAGQLSDKYVLPLYFGAANPLTLDARLYVGVP